MDAMRILVAPDKFKGVQSAREVAQNVARGLRDVLTNADIDLAPVADGGEGTAELIGDALNGAWRECEAHDAMGKAMSARYLWLAGNIAVMEMNEVAGLRRVPASNRDIERATTFGVGEMIRDAARAGACQIIVGLGGSATNDGGFGMARALGIRFLDERGEEIKKQLVDLCRLAHIDMSRVLELTPGQIVAAADVRNPLLGPNGATRMFGSQKGASSAQLDLLEEALARMAEVVTLERHVDYRSEAGAGAAGGLGFGLMGFCGATMRRGFDVVAEAIDLESKIKWADVVITGEGSLDRQTLEGKAPAEVALIARRHGKRVFAIVGRSDGDARLAKMFENVYTVANPELNDEENIERAPQLLREGARRLAKLLL
jgi:glycerate kinase